MVVLRLDSEAWPSRAASNRARSTADGRRRSSPIPDRIDVQGNPDAGSMGEPLALTTATAPTLTCASIPGVPMMSPAMVTVVPAVPTPPWRPAALAPVPAPTDPHDCPPRRAPATARLPNSAPGRFAKLPPRPRSNTTAAGTTGTTPARSSGEPIGNPSPCSSSQPTTPSAAARPNALPPVRHTAWITSTRFSGRSASVSRVPGPPPRTLTPGVAPSGTNTTVVPVCHPRPDRWWWPTRTPATSVIEPNGAVDIGPL